MLNRMFRALGNYLVLGLLVAVLWFGWGKPALNDLDAEVPPLRPPAGGTAPQLGSADAQAAMTQLEALPVKGRSPKTGYSRDEFYSGWTDPDGNGCHTRQDVLLRDMQVASRDGCVATVARIIDPYTGQEFTDPSDLDIDHVVALADAWVKGASGWDKDTRARFAQDPNNLLAVSASANRQKGAGDAATWLPSNKSYRCSYVSIQISVKSDYGLWVTEAERDAMRRILTSCGG